jgi:hypothetical protein
VWIVNHRTLLPAEVPILLSLGFEVLIPKIIPSHDPGYRSGVVTYDYDETLTLRPSALRVLNEHDFYQRSWSPTVSEIMGEFDVVICSVSAYLAPLREAAHHFGGRLVARVFGREHPRRYTEFLAGEAGSDLLAALDRMSNRFVFGQGFANLADVEDPVLQARAHTICVPLPESAYVHRDEWVGGDRRAILLCPGISDSGYYRGVYESIKRDFGDLPHAIFGRQVGPVDDPAVLPYLSDRDLIRLYARAPVFVYPSTEPRHVHYSPLEAMVVGTPVLYRKDSLIDVIAAEPLPGRCADTDEMRAKARALLAGDRTLADEVRAAQHTVVSAFAIDLARDQWAAALNGAGR